MQRRGLRLFLNTEIGTDLSMRDLAQRYHAVARRRRTPGPGARGVRRRPGRQPFRDRLRRLVQRAPRLRRPQLRPVGRHAVIIGNGNVALDVARILTGDPERLARTDIADHAPDRPRRQHHRGRHRDRPARTGPSRVLGQGNPQSGSDAGHLGRACRGTGTRPGQRRSGRWTAGIAGSLQARPARRSSAGSDTDRKITLRFLAEPVELVGRAGVEAIRLRRTELVATTTGDVRAVATDETEELACDLVFRAIGFRGAPVAGLPFDDTRGVIPNRDGAVVDPHTDEPIPGMYVAGWIKRGPSGVIGTNKHCAQQPSPSKPSPRSCKTSEQAASAHPPTTPTTSPTSCPTTSQPQAGAASTNTNAPSAEPTDAPESRSWTSTTCWTWLCNGPEQRGGADGWFHPSAPTDAVPPGTIRAPGSPGPARCRCRDR